MEKLLLDLINLFGRVMPELSTIDEDYGQLEMIDQQDRDTYPLTYPALLIDAPDAQWSNIAGLSQKGLATIRARLILDCYDDTHHGSGTTDRIAERAEMCKKVHKFLQGYMVDEKSTLIRTTSRFFTWNHGIKVYEQTYTCVVTEMIELPTVKVSAAPLVSPELMDNPQGFAENVLPRVDTNVEEHSEGRIFTDEYTDPFV